MHWRSVGGAAGECHKERTKPAAVIASSTFYLSLLRTGQIEKGRGSRRKAAENRALLSLMKLEHREDTGMVRATKARAQRYVGKSMEDVRICPARSTSSYF